MRNAFKTAVLLAFLGALFMAFGALIGGSGGLVFGLALGLLFCGGTYWFSDKLAIASARAQPVSREDDPELYAMVEDLARRARIPMPRVYVSPEQQPNAFATGRSPANGVVCVTEGLRRVLTPEEIKGVLAHEMAHVKHRDILIGSVAAAIAMAITFVARLLMWGAMFGGSDDDNNSPLGILGLLAMVILAPLAAALIQMAVSRSREYEADAGGARLLGDGEPLARALEKIEVYAKQIPMAHVNPAQENAFIVNPFQTPPGKGGNGRRRSLGSYFRTHPPTEDRVARLRAMRF